MTNNPQLSDCCKAPVRSAHGCDADFGHGGKECDCKMYTAWNECTGCNKPCDVFVDEKKELLGFDPTSPDGDYGAKVYGHVAEDGSVTINKIETQEYWEKEFDALCDIREVRMATRCNVATYENNEIKKLRVCNGSLDGWHFNYSDGTQDHGEIMYGVGMLTKPVLQKFIRTLLQQTYNKTQKEMIRKMQARCDVTENEDGRLLLEWFKNSVQHKEYQLDLCEKCTQMTNFLDGVCQKCKIID